MHLRTLSLSPAIRSTAKERQPSRRLGTPHAMSNTHSPSTAGTGGHPSRGSRAARAPRRTVRLALAAALAAACAASAAPAQGAPIAAESAGGFRDSAGVQLHTNFTGFAGDTTSIERLQGMLDELGIWHVRDSVCLAKESECARPRLRLSQLRDSLGTGQPKVDLLLNIAPEVETDPLRSDRDVDLTRGLVAAQSAPLAGMVAGIEPTNEPDLQKRSDWAQITIGDNATIRNRLAQRQFSSLRTVPLLTPALGRSEATGTLLGSGWNPSQPAQPNFHPYPPAWGGPENALTGACLRGASVLQCVSKLSPSGGAPVATESGYSTTGGAASANWVSERAQSVYLPRLLLDNYAKGVARTYLYELVDLGPDKSSATNGFGLYKSYYKDFSTIVAGGPKPAATALSRLNARIGDAGGASLPGTLDVSLTGADGSTLGEADIRRVLLRRSDGTYVLALWQPKAVWSNVPNKQRTIEVPDVPVSVQVTAGNRTYWNATAFRPTLDDIGRTFLHTDRFTTPVGADVTLIDLRPFNTWSTVPGPRYTLLPG